MAVGIPGNETLTQSLSIVMNDFSFSNMFALLQPLLLFMLGMVLYAIFIFKFYRFAARKDLFEMDVIETGTKPGFFGKILDGISFALKYLCIFPVLLFFWFLVITLLLTFLTKLDTIGQVLLIAVALIGSVRVTAYYDEDLSKDLAKMLPFAMLGVFIIDINYFSFETSITLLKQIPSMWNTLLYYFLMITMLEFVLRIGFEIYKKFSKEYV